MRSLLAVPLTVRSATPAVAGLLVTLLWAGAVVAVIAVVGYEQKWPRATRLRRCTIAFAAIVWVLAAVVLPRTGARVCVGVCA